MEQFYYEYPPVSLKTARIELWVGKKPYEKEFLKLIANILSIKE